ncbi:DUF6932 family protein [uncultured Parasphingorhabdus sp.]|uniref:DUF6932 family protein n=1 Tax=uncultured Parasphingorhabdus sp. TaxID=2709694 RepID=UPI002AA8E33B|nr:hypothetical protein [uncultured Parasphingorhabdus sp.]
MLPQLISGEFQNQDVLPSGIHDSTFAEFVSRYVFNEHRNWLFQGFKQACLELREAGCRQVYVGGSFVTSKMMPSDWDAIWDPANVDPARLDELFYIGNLEAERVLKFRGDLMLGKARDVATCPHIALFSTTRSGFPTGLIRLKLNQIEMLNS